MLGIIITGTAVLLSGVGVLAMSIARSAAQGDKTKPRNAPDEDGRTRCHYCDEWVESEPVVLKCPNCKDKHTYHTECGFNLREAAVPQCHGVDVRHASGHILNVKYPNMCAKCNLGKMYWDEWNCADNAAELNENRLFAERRKGNPYTR